ncbi:MAG: hypothetical protein ACXABY_13940 [Candidatus Thorarchaeota archaeon]
MEVDGDTKLMTPGDLDLALSVETPPEAIIWFLPYEDHFPKAFFERSWYLSDEMRPRVLPKLRGHYWPPECLPPPDDVKVTGATNVSGEIRPTIWVNGEIVGRWELEKKNDEFGISFKIIQKVRPKYDNMISERARELEDFVNTRLVPISRAK